MLAEFLGKFRSQILDRCRVRIDELCDSSPQVEPLLLAPSAFLDCFHSGSNDRLSENHLERLSAIATAQGAEFHRLEYTLSQVLQTYGMITQSVLDVAEAKLRVISTSEFRELNLYLEIALVSAAAEFQRQCIRTMEADELRRFGGLAHELRNTLSSVTIAYEMLKSGLVGTGGITSRVLENNLVRIRALVDRSLLEVKSRTRPELLIANFKLHELVDQVLVTINEQINRKQQVLTCSICPSMQVETDQHLLHSCVANLIQNAVKYTPNGRGIWITCVQDPNEITMSITNECGVKQAHEVENFFTAFVSGRSDKSGLGLGLNIVERSISILGGRIQGEYDPVGRCVFTLTFPSKFDRGKNTP